MATVISRLSPSSSYPFLPPPRSRNLDPSFCLSLKQPNNTSHNAAAADNDNLRVVFAAGGRIYPAVAIADELRITNPTCQILFIGTPNSMESTAVPSAGYDFAVVRSQNFLFLPFRLIKSLIQCFRKLDDFKPHVVAGTGGHVSFPVCLAAKLKSIKLVIQEQNSVPGIANSILSVFADVILVAFNSTIDSFPRNKCVVCGNPVRLSLRKHEVSKETARSHFFSKSNIAAGDDGSVSKKAKVLLVLGGSFGAHAINIAMLNLYYQMLRGNENLYIIWQTGVEAYDEMDSLVKDHPRLYLTPPEDESTAVSLPATWTYGKPTAADPISRDPHVAIIKCDGLGWFMHRLDLAYAAADLIVSRAGALTCYEILATGKPSILIPSPNVSEGHQFKNASLMADLAGVTVITEDELDSSTLAIAIEQIFRDERKMADMSERALKAANPNASSEIAKHILSLVNLSKQKKNK